MELEALRRQMEKRMDAGRFEHVLGCEQEAAQLAARFGGQAEKARIGALLHDVTKGLDPAGQLQLCEKYDILPDIVERCEPKLLHALTGSALARAEFGAQEDICQAIRWHTTGKGDMALLEKILYLADYIEPTRKFPGVDALRTLALKNLDAAVLKGLTMSLNELSQAGRLIHPRTVEARNWLIMKGTVLE